MVHLSSPVGLPDCLPEHLNDCDLGLFYLFFSGCLQAWCAACECQVCTPYAGWCAGFPLTNMCLPCLLSPPVCLPNLQALSLSWSPPPPFCDTFFIHLFISHSHTVCPSLPGLSVRCKNKETNSAALHFYGQNKFSIKTHISVSDRAGGNHVW